MRIMDSTLYHPRYSLQTYTTIHQISFLFHLPSPFQYCYNRKLRLWLPRSVSPSPCRTGLRDSVPRDVSEHSDLIYFRFSLSPSTSAFPHPLFLGMTSPGLDSPCSSVSKGSLLLFPFSRPTGTCPFSTHYPFRTVLNHSPLVIFILRFGDWLTYPEDNRFLWGLFGTFNSRVGITLPSNLCGTMWGREWLVVIQKKGLAICLWSRRFSEVGL